MCGPQLTRSALSIGTLTTALNSTLTSAPCPTLHPTTDTTYQAIYTQFAAAVAGKGDVAVQAEEARDVIRLIELAKRSSEEGRTVDVYPLVAGFSCQKSIGA